MSCKNTCCCACAHQETGPTVKPAEEIKIKPSEFKPVDANIIYSLDKKGNQYFSNLSTGVIIRITADGMANRCDLIY